MAEIKIKCIHCGDEEYVNLEEPLAVRLEMDEMWGRVYCKETPCWLWHAINREKMTCYNNYFSC